VASNEIRLPVAVSLKKNKREARKIYFYPESAGASLRTLWGKTEDFGKRIILGNGSDEIIELLEKLF